MSQGTVLYRFRLDLSDVDRGVYERFDFRMAQHASESLPFLLTRMLAYSLNVGEGLVFSDEGLADPDEPCLSSDDPRGGKSLWIEVGNPSARRLHKAAKAARQVKVYTYKNPDALIREIRSQNVHNAKQIEVYSFSEEFLAELEDHLDRDNEWGVVRDHHSLMVVVGEDTIQGELRAH